MSDPTNPSLGNNPISSTTLEEILSDVLQEQAFMFAEHGDDQEVDSPSAPFMHARIQFNGPCSGRLGLVFTQNLCSELIINMLGMDSDDLEEEDIADAFKELLNVVCGKFLIAAFGPMLKFDLSIPTVEKIDLDQWLAQKSNQHTTVLMVEDEVVLFELRL